MKSPFTVPVVAVQFAIIAFLFWIHSAVVAGEKVTFAGFAFSGMKQELRFAYTKPLLSGEEGNNLNRELSRLVKRNPPQHFELSEDFGTFSEGETLASAFVMDGETVEVEDCGGALGVGVRRRSLHDNAMVRRTGVVLCHGRRVLPAKRAV